ncbi:PAS domain-containing protein [Jannaschia sp. LMIT008]|uniref:PAS domain-containing protein n=1 Tax=Jannaschia maritima TaxID=3032585 RepID=UPI002811E9EB|nr:PAS domain-containing protein [Jannaschia sp. LMIT008]
MGIEDGMNWNDRLHDMTGERMARTSPVLEEAWRYWTGLRRGTALPLREALEPRAMSLILGHSMILDRARPGTVRVRLSGRVPNALMGMETRGLPVRAFFDLLQRSQAIEVVEQVFTTPATLELDLLSENAEGTLAARLLILPLRDRRDDVSKALAVLVPERIVTGEPRRFSILRQNLAPVAAPSRQVPVPEQTAAGTVVGDAWLEEELQRMRPHHVAAAKAATAPTDVPWLRVVK